MNKMLFGYNFGKLSVAIIPAGQAKAERGDWQEIDANTLPPAAKAKYEAYKAKYREAKGLKDEFEALLREAAGIKGETKAEKAAVPKLTLSQFIASQNASGHRC